MMAALLVALKAINLDSSMRKPVYPPPWTRHAVLLASSHQDLAFVLLMRKVVACPASSPRSLNLLRFYLSDIWTK